MTTDKLRGLVTGRTCFTLVNLHEWLICIIAALTIVSLPKSAS